MKARLASLLYDVALTLRSRCINLYGYAWLQTSKEDRAPFRHPPMIPIGKVVGVPLAALTRELYGEPGYTVDHIVEVWEGLEAGVYHVNDIFSALPAYCNDIGDDRAALVQFLIAASFHRGRLTLTDREATLRLSKTVELSVGPRSVGGPKGLRFRRDPITFKPIEVPRLWLGRSRNASPPMSALYEFLVAKLPMQAEGLEVLFAIVSRLGFEGEKELREAFEIEYVDPEDKVAAGEWQAESMQILQLQQQINAL